MNWTELTEEAQIETILQESQSQAVVIYKHSTRCGISSMVKSRLERETPPPNIKFYYLDVIRSRDISNMVAERFNVYHESPQVLLIRNGECIYEESHNAITMDELSDQANAA